MTSRRRGFLWTACSHHASLPALRDSVDEWKQLHSDLRAKGAAEVLQAAIKAPITYGFGVVDGYVVPEHPAKAYAEGRLNRVPLLAGWFK